MRKTLFLFGLLALVSLMIGCGMNADEQSLQIQIDQYTEQMKPLEKTANLAYWSAAITGQESNYNAYAAADLKMKQLQSDPAVYQKLKTFKESGQIRNSIMKRELDVLLNEFQINQIEPELLEKIVTLSANIEQNFSTFRGEIKGRTVTSNEIDQILKTETRSGKRKAAWLASKQVGPMVADDIIKLVKLRNQAARALGYENYHTLKLETSELNVKALDAIFEELESLTAKPYAELKSELDGILAESYQMKVKDLRPWHYHDPFFQETPLVYNVDLDAYYTGKDVQKLAVDFFEGIDLEVQSILDRSDLFEKEGKNPHAFCTDIDREGDIRILCNIKDNERWMETMLHELGHAIYDEYINPDLPFTLRSPAHSFTTEAIAMFFGRLSRNPIWMQTMLNLSGKEREELETVTTKYMQLKQIIFARWSMVMYNFEKALYANPDSDLNTLWWDMVERYQLVTRPANRNEPDWAAKIHFTIAPCYYQNYLMGELFASQLHFALASDIPTLANENSPSYINQAAVGTFLKQNVFLEGNRYPWNEMIERATGETLAPKYFVTQFIQ
ncbi:M2 family metallopeptidase [candidate division KSB1 bacterium]|nr:M2 family metallopeptidase [candidate division KSB1 bacterium]